MRSWVKANGGPLAVILAGIGIGGFTNRWGGLGLIAIGGVWVVVVHSPLMIVRRSTIKRLKSEAARNPVDETSLHEALQFAWADLENYRLILERSVNGEYAALSSASFDGWYVTGARILAKFPEVHRAFRASAIAFDDTYRVVQDKRAGGVPAEELERTLDLIAVAQLEINKALNR